MNYKINKKAKRQALLRTTESKLVQIRSVIENIQFMEREISPLIDFLNNNKGTYIHITVKSSSKHSAFDFDCMPSRTIVYPMLKKTIESYRYKKRILEKQLEKLI